MNPVFAGLCADPAAYPWSSCGSRVSPKRFAWLDDAPLYLDLGTAAEERRQRYREFLQQSISDEEKGTILGAVQRGQLTGGKSFVDAIESRLQRRVELRGRGRPRKEPT